MFKLLVNKFVNDQFEHQLLNTKLSYEIILSIIFESFIF